MNKQFFLRWAFHFACYYAAWLISIIAASKQNAILGPITVLIITVIQFFVLKVRHHDTQIILFIFTLAFIGFIVDSFFVYLNFLQLKANPFYPLSSPWMIGLWINFSIIFYDCFYDYFHKFFIFGVLALFGFPVAYYSGVILNAAYLPEGFYSLIFLGIVWAVLFPTILHFFRRNA